MQRDPKQPVDEEYTKKIKEYTTKPFFNSPLTDYLPASKNVPTPKAVLGDIAGAPGILPYTAEVNSYMRMLEKASPRVKVFSIGTSEEGREMIAVAISSESNLAKLDENRERLAKLADPRKINMNDNEAAKIISKTTPIYYIAGTIHSPETGAPTALMELAYRLAVDESLYIKDIREHLITLITPVVETDGRDRQVDLYRWHLAHPKENYPPLIYWGHYVAHDNNRDAMGLSLKLTRNVLKTYLDWKPQVLHDLHESVPYLYDNTVGDQPYNAWLDPILTNEWQILGWQNVGEMTKFGMPGVFAHGTFDTWSPSYLMFIAATHNGISRLYETFGNGGADTIERTLSPSETSRTWYRQNPPLPKTLWSQRNNNNYEQTGILVSLSFFVERSQQFLNNFYLKSKRSIEKPTNEGPAAYVFPADDPRPGGQAELLRILQRQGCEVHRTTSPFSITFPVKLPAKKAGSDKDDKTDNNVKSAGDEKQKSDKPAIQTRHFPAGSYIVRMDQPYSRIADMMLDLQYWSPSDSQIPYDDTAWTFGELGNTGVVRVTDRDILRAPMQLVMGEIEAPSVVSGSGNTFLVNHNADNTLISLRYRLRNANFLAAEEPFEAAGHKFNRGSFIISGVSTVELDKAANDLGLTAYVVAAAPQIATHPIKAARVAMLHTWLSTQDEGWWRIAFDQLDIPYDYISTQTVAQTANLREKYDVIVFAPTGTGNPKAIVSGLPMFGNPLPWKKSELTPNLGSIDATDDMRPSLGWQGVTNLQNFVDGGGVLISSMDTSNFAVDYGFTSGVSTS
ncbi:MAG: M14 family zinc carboxypeptidase, partial [Pyrinomonadaceae bacterium]